MNDKTAGETVGERMIQYCREHNISYTTVTIRETEESKESE